MGATILALGKLVAVRAGINNPGFHPSASSGHTTLNLDLTDPGMFAFANIIHGSQGSIPVALLNSGNLDDNDNPVGTLAEAGRLCSSTTKRWMSCSILLAGFSWDVRSHYASISAIH
jgi:hypothetical protein